MVIPLNLSDKKFWENYWYYYKYHTLAGIFALIIIITSVKGCIDNVNPDFSLAYIGSGIISQESVVNAENSMVNAVGDLNGDKKLKVQFNNLRIDKTDPQFAIAMVQKADVELMAGDSVLILTDEEYFKRYSQMGAFAPLDKNLLDTLKIAPEKQKSLQNGEIAGIDITDTAFAKKLKAVKSSNLILSVKVMSLDKKNDKKVQTVYQKANEIFSSIIRGDIK